MVEFSAAGAASVGAGASASAGLGRTASEQEQGLVLRFQVEIDGHGTLGIWTKCEGLQVEYDVHEYREGGQNNFVHRIPGRAKYQNVKLTRPVDKNSAKVAEWLASLQRSVKRHTAKISLLDSDGDNVATWSLGGCFPMRWTLPTLDVAGNQVAVETLELVHNGFLEQR